MVFINIPKGGYTSGHYIERCMYCDVVITQCRCPDVNKEHRLSVCWKCGFLPQEEKERILKEKKAAKD